MPFKIQYFNGQQKQWQDLPNTPVFAEAVRAGEEIADIASDDVTLREYKESEGYRIVEVADEEKVDQPEEYLALTVGQLIDLLQQIEDKSMPVAVMFQEDGEEDEIELPIRMSHRVTAEYPGFCAIHVER